MSRTLTLSDDVYSRLAEQARRRSMSIEELLRAWSADTYENECATDVEMQARRDAVQRSITLYTQLAARHGAFPDSTDLLREDRAR